MKKRVQISLTFSADLDPFVGPGHNLEDWIAYVRHALTRDHMYDPRVSVGTVRVVAPTWKDHEARFGREDT